VVPLVRLGFGEEPERQLREIVRLILVPMLAFATFLGLWTVLAPRHKTKSGEVPTPAVVWDAASHIWKFHVRESRKEQAFTLPAAERQQELVAAKERLSLLVRYESAAAEQVAEAESANTERVASAVTALETRRAEVAAEIDEQRQARQASLETEAQQLAPGDVTSRQAYLDAMRNHLATTEQEARQLADFDSQIAAARTAKSPSLHRANATLTGIVEEMHYLRTLIEQLEVGNRHLKVEREIASLKTHQKEFLLASAPFVATAAQQVLQAESRVNAAAMSQYAKPWTLPMQIARSVACVFAGFLLGTLIAVPVGILCGLSETFMAAMTPFIALFKPVSPIVWLPIALIIVGGFITDPDSHWLIHTLEQLPLIGWMKINPAFIASAITVSLCSLWATMVNTALGVASVDKDHLNVARVLKLGFWSRLFKIIVPSALPLIFTGLRISLGVGWMVLVAGELLSSSEGIGKFVWDQFNNGASDSFAKMMVVVFVVGVIGLLLDRMMVVLQRLVSFDGLEASI
jgi:nitrate/nitrite transport system permease protein